MDVPSNPPLVLSYYAPAAVGPPCDRAGDCDWGTASLIVALAAAVLSGVGAVVVHDGDVIRGAVLAAAGMLAGLVVAPVAIAGAVWQGRGRGLALVALLIAVGVQGTTLASLWHLR